MTPSDIPRREPPARMLIAAACCFLLAAPAPAADWPWWRGPTHDGLVAEASGWPGGWPAKELWRRSVGYGCTSPILVGGKLYVMGWQGPGGRRSSQGTDTVYCLDAATGRQLWKQTYPCPYQGRVRTGDTSAYGGPSSTPSFDPATGFLYTISTDGDLHCWDTARGGRRVWKLNLYDAYKAPQRPNVGGGRRDYGYPGSALIRGEQIIVEVGAREGTVMGFDKRTGRRVWTSQYNQPAGHSACPVPMKLAGADCIALLTLQNLVVMRAGGARAGQTVATHKWQTEFACNIPTPAALGNRLVATSAYNNKVCTLFEVSAGDSAGAMRKRWSSRYYATTSSPVIHKGRVYVIGGAIHCLDLATGRLIWRGGNFGNGSCLVTSDDKIIAFGNHRVCLLEAGPATREYRELSRVEGVGRAICYPHLALSDGVLCCKDRDGNVVCLSIKPGERRTTAGDLTPTTPSPPTGPPAPPRPAIAAGPSPHAAPLPKLSADWPGNAEAAVFLWQAGPADKAAVGTFAPREQAALNKQGQMAFTGRGAMTADGLSAALKQACMKSNQLAIEAVITPADLRQTGPARIISFSLDGYHRNFSLCQERDQLIFRLRTTRTGENGMNPQTPFGRLTAGKRHHAIVTYSPGRLICYLNGKVALDTDRIQGDFSNWADQHLLFGDEWNDHRYWAGLLDHVAIHSRVIGAKEAAARYKLAAGGG